MVPKRGTPKYSSGWDVSNLTGLWRTMGVGDGTSVKHGTFQNKVW